MRHAGVVDSRGSAPEVLVWFGVLGTLTVRLGGEERPFPAGRPGRLLASLLLAEGRLVSAHQLVDSVWGEELPAGTQAALHKTVHRVRRALGPAADLLTHHPSGYRLDRSGVALDADRFLEEAAAARAEGTLDAYDTALAWWRGPAWGEHAADLAAGAAMRLEEARLSLREDRAALLLELGRVAEASGALRLLAEEHPLRERPVALLMRAQHASGDVPQALAAYDEHRARLAEELGLDPSAELATLHQQVLRRSVERVGRVGTDRPLAQPESQLESGPGPAADAEAEGRRAPVPPRLHGRDAHLASIRAMLAQRRCVSVVGPGGVGKTSVAAAAAVAGQVAGEAGSQAGATRSPEAAPAPVWWVDLTRVSDDTGVRPLVAEAMQVQVFPGADADAVLRRRLETASGLLVLDNCEHVLGACADLVAEVLARGELRVLTTSRERLGVVGEQVFPLPPLQLPPPGTEEEGAAGPAVALFLERAAAAAPDLHPDADTLQTVAGLVRSLDGLPLAIELAAGRLGSVTLEDLRDRLHERLDVLRTGSPRTPSRHRTLAATVEWSFALLSEEERRVFTGLSVFAGQFDLAAAEAVLGPGAADVVADLVDRSLVVRPGVTGKGRYRLLETLRAFARARLGEAEREYLARDHAAWATGVAARAAAGVEGPDEARWSREVEQSLPDLGAAHAWAVERGEAETAARIVAALQPWAYYRLRADVLGWAHDVLAMPGALPPRLVPAVRAAASAHRWMLGQFDAARDHAVEGVRAAGGRDTPDAVRVQNSLGDLDLVLGDLDAAHRAYLGATLAADRDGQRLDAAISACGALLSRVFAGLPHEEDLARMRSLVSAVDNPTTRAFCLYGEGEALAPVEPEEALASLRRSVELAETAGSHLVRGVAMTAETALLARSGHLDAATVDRTVAAIRHWFGSGNESLFVTCLRNVVPLLSRLGCHAAVVELWAALVAASPDRPSYGAEAERVEACLAVARSELGDAFAAAWTRGSDRATVEAARAAVAVLEEARRAL
jgi:predicted ATPase/DNA-binding SARP family transcriptional activator